MAFISLNSSFFEPSFFPKRIISTVPSLTELLVDLEVGDRLVGRTRFCIHPKEKLKTIENIGGTKSLKLEKIASIQPDLIIANKEENQKEDIEALAKDYPVLLTDMSTIEEALQMILDVGRLTNCVSAAQKWYEVISPWFDPKNIKPLSKPQNVLYLIWEKPSMSIGQDTFIDKMLERQGFNNVFGSSARYPEISEEDIRNNNPDLIFLSSEPYPFKEKHRAAWQEIFPNAQVVLVDGEMFSWYGSRMALAADYFEELKRSLQCVDGF